MSQRARAAKRPAGRPTGRAPPNKLSAKRVKPSRDPAGPAKRAAKGRPARRRDVEEEPSAESADEDEEFGSAGDDEDDAHSGVDGDDASDRQVDEDAGDAGEEDDEEGEGGAEHDLLLEPEPSEDDSDGERPEGFAVRHAHRCLRVYRAVRLIAHAHVRPSAQDLGVHKWLVDSCATLGIRRPTKIQARCIPAILKGGSVQPVHATSRMHLCMRAGDNVIGRAKTGSGKTAAFALPILQKLAADPYGVFALVLTPTRCVALAWPPRSPQAAKVPCPASWPSRSCTSSALSACHWACRTSSLWAAWVSSTRTPQPSV